VLRYRDVPPLPVLLSSLAASADVALISCTRFHILQVVKPEDRRTVAEPKGLGSKEPMLSRTIGTLAFVEFQGAIGSTQPFETSYGVLHRLTRVSPRSAVCVL
jgi:hypothetical protein